MITGIGGGALQETSEWMIDGILNALPTKSDLDED